MATTWFYNETRWPIQVKQQNATSWTTIPAGSDKSYTTTTSFDYFLVNQSHAQAKYIRWHSNFTTSEVEPGVIGYILSDDNKIQDKNGTPPSDVSFNEYNYDEPDPEPEPEPEPDPEPDTGFKVEIRPYFDGTHDSDYDWEYSTTGTIKVNNIIQNFSGYEFLYWYWWGAYLQKCQKA